MKKILIVFLALATNFAYAQNHEHHSEHTKQEKHASPSGDKKFVPTNDLKMRMEKILTLTKELEDKKGNKKIVTDYGGKIVEVVNDIFKTCKLEPDADAAIHPILGKILEGSKDLKKGNYDKGHLKIKESLSEYEKVFPHEGLNH